jgi:chromatin segregation and condensation protein Rec8/ScpA/Scc1 (kleisin family)
MTFLAGLELTRRRILFLRQTRPFAELWMYRREEEPESPDQEHDGELGSSAEPPDNDMTQADEGDALA